ncbi:LAME_0G03488g1_1 [Lachancea meyersii CBS 8951]|uniref:LAME_0G03488g1_1 n=1 Tax=Lachancea meyersii CBS 8951 TaxID=1266667 RepID=A0A1G4K6N8_9SACH|nr:LAME_0G03488g1_1 [Lachancea meyersii CBS 8951]
MGPPASSHRLGDKKPYHPSPRYASYRRPSPSMGNGSNPTQNSGLGAISGTVSGPQQGFASGNRPRPSRYNPSVSGRPYSSSSNTASNNGNHANHPRVGSRYNSDFSPSYQSHVRSSSAHDSRRFSNGPSNYHHHSSSASSSRYNSVHQQAPAALKQGYHNYYSPSPSSRRRPSSVSDGNDPATQSYPARGNNKWRDSYSSDYHEQHPSSSSAHSTHSASQISEKSSIYAPSRNHNNLQPYSNRYLSFGQERENDIRKRPPALSLENEHSLGSSLINSVPQTTREIEAKVATEHERIDFGKQKATEHRSENEKNQTREESPDVQSPEPMLRKEEPISNRDVDDNNDTNEKNVKVDETDASYAVPATLEEGDSLSMSSIDKIELGAAPPSSATLPSSHTENAPEAQNEPVNEASGCIFPMGKAQLKLWELRSRRRSSIVRHQKYRLKRPIISLDEYPFMSQNIVVHEQAIKPVLLESLGHLKRYEELRRLQLKKTFIDLDQKWSENCQKLEEISQEVKQETIDDDSAADHTVGAQKSKETEDQNQQNRAVSRRRNRGDFVDDNEIESVLLQIDPDYKHHQLAAQIPAMIINPLKKQVIRFKDVNNLVTDKDSWAARINRDGIDTFTNEEHALFVEAYLTYPKRFGKISQNMGGLRQPEECVLHYYRTKKKTNYKQLLMERNKKRKVNAGRRRKEKDKERDSSKMDENLEVSTEANDLSKKERQELVDETEDDEGEQSVKDVHVESSTEVVKTNFNEKLSPVTSVVVGNPHGVESVSQAEKEQETEAETECDVDTASVVATTYYAEPTSRENLEEYAEVDHNSSKRKVEELEEVTNELPNLHPIAPVITANSKEFSTVEEPLPSGKLEESEKAQQPKKRARHSEGFHKSSYWSVKESNLFPELLKEYGTQWALISEKLGTKSTTMVRNYFQRNADQMGWQSLAEGSNANQGGSKEEEAQSGSTVVETHLDGMPSQQTPSVSIFNHANRDASTPMQIPTLSTMDSFSQQSTPHGLPPPRLPSIQLHTQQTNVDAKKNLMTQAVLEPAPTHSVHFAPSLITNTTGIHSTNHSSGASSSNSSQVGAESRRSSIKSLLNNDASEPHATQPQLPKPIEQSSVNSTGTNVIVQELQSFNYPVSATGAAPPAIHVPTEPTRNPGSISSILNGASSPNFGMSQGPPRVAISQFPKPTLDLHSGKKPILPPVTLHSPHVLGPLTPSSTDMLTNKPPEFNFASDPLAALAAVASAPEALASFVPPDGRGNQHSSSG